MLLPDCEACSASSTPTQVPQSAKLVRFHTRILRVKAQ